MLDREKQLAQYRELARSSLVGWCSIAYPGWTYFPHIRPIVAAIEDALAGISPRLLISEPPRHGKSLTIAELAPAYVVGREPRAKFIQGCYGDRLVNKFGRSTRDLVRSELFRYVFGFGISPDSTSVQYFQTEGGGEYLATSIGGAAIGFGANVFSIDDPFKNRKQAESPTYRKEVQDFLTGVAYQRLEDFDDGRPAIIIGTATRWHPDDLHGYCQREMSEEGWRVINLPAVRGPDGLPCNPDDPGAIPLFPEKFSLERYARIKRAIGGYEWEAQYQGNPTPQEGGIIKVEWFPRYRVLPRIVDTIQSWDTANKKTVTSAFSTCGTFVSDRRRSYLKSVYREKLKYPELRRMAINLAERDNPSAVLIEDKASGIQLIQDLRASTSIPVIPIEPEADKITRAYSESAEIEAGMILLPELAEWLPDFETEVRGFPTGNYADQIDMLTQFLRWHRTRGAAFDFATTGARDSAAPAPSGSGGFASTG